jgi:hypothetical protein
MPKLVTADAESWPRTQQALDLLELERRGSYDQIETLKAA